MTDFAALVGYFILAMLAAFGAFVIICALRCKLAEWFGILQSHERHNYPTYVPLTREEARIAMMEGGR